MIVSKIVYNNTAYYDMHAEQCLNNLLLDDGIYAKSVNKKALDEVSEDIKKDCDNSVFVLDFNNVESVQVNVFDENMKKLFNIKNKTIIISNIIDRLVDQIYGLAYIKAHNEKYIQYTNEGNKYSFFTINEYDCSSIVDRSIIFKEIFTKELIDKYLVKKDKSYHHSSSVYLSSYVDIKKFITQGKPLMLYAIYSLAMKIKKHWLVKDGDRQNLPVLVCQSLNGSFIASVLSALLNLDMYILDQIGPINKLYRNLGSKISSEKNYIIVSDVVCLGTEIKIAKSIINYHGGIYRGNVSIIRVNSIKEYDDIEEVFVIDKDNSGALNYRITTALDE